MAQVESLFFASPYVSVVIPVYNDVHHLRETLEALEKQTYPDEKCEVFVVDNGSTDESVEVASSFGDVAVLFEHQHLSSPYSARNRGIEASSGDVITLLDATCVPVKDWMEEGVRCLVNGESDLVGGNVDFAFRGERPTAAEVYDSVTNVQMKESIEQGKAKTANLFIKRDLFMEIGLFPERVRSGGDVQWTRRAVKEGYLLSYCEGATVYKPARQLSSLVKKQWRVGKGKPAIWREERREIGLMKLAILAVLPPGFSWLKEKAENRGYINGKGEVFTLWVVRYIISFVMRSAEFVSTLRHYVKG
jgi:cellulose synthase/poly-beta-1,6-N-acetylglucosamine synthase-like glycosyltransferase